MKRENSIQRLFCSELLRRQRAPRAERVAPQAPSLELHSASHHQVALALTVSVSICALISICFVHPLARGVLG